MELISRFRDPEVKANTKLILMGATLPIKHNYRLNPTLCTHLLLTSQREKDAADNAVVNPSAASPKQRRRREIEEGGEGF